MPKIIALRSLANNKFVVAEDGGNQPLIANRDAIGEWEMFEVIEVDSDPPVIEPPDGHFVMPGFPIKIPHSGQLRPIGMSYWRNINQHKNQEYIKVLLSINDQLTIFTLGKNDLVVRDVYPLDFHHTGEGCFFSAHNPELLYIPLGNEMLAVNVLTNERSVIFSLPNNEIIWQAHCSYDEKIWSCTVKDANYNIKEWLVYSRYSNSFRRYPVLGVPDECQIDKSGDWLLIKEDDLNRVVNIGTGVVHIIRNEDGALGHSDMGFYCALGENDMSNLPGALDLINFETREHFNIYSTGIWNMGYVSYTNAPSKYCLITTPTELIKVNIETGEGIKVCNNLTESQEYDRRPKANLCPNGEFAAWTAFVGGQLEAFVVRIPVW